jgi:hypothetical protein
VFDWKRKDPIERFVARVLPFIVACPAIDTVGVDVGMLDALMGSKAWKRLSTLSIGYARDEKDSAVALWKRLPDHITKLRCDWSGVTFRREPKGGVTLEIRLPDRYGTLNGLESLWIGDVAKLDALKRIEVEAPAKRIGPTAFREIERKGALVVLREPVFRSGLAAGIGA